MSLLDFIKMDSKLKVSCYKKFRFMQYYNLKKNKKQKKVSLKHFLRKITKPLIIRNIKEFNFFNYMFSENNNLISSSLLFGEYYLNTNQMVNKYIFCSRNSVEIFSTRYVQINFSRIQGAFSSICRKKINRTFNIFFCSRTQIYAKLLENTSISTGMPCSTGAWNAGTLTNNLLELKKLPDILFVPDIKNNKEIVKESDFLNIPIVGLLSSGVTNLNVSYPIIANSNDIINILFFIRLFCRLLTFNTFKSSLDVFKTSK